MSRAEIEKRLWTDGVFVDFEHGVNVAVKKLRQALLDSATSPRYIETVVGEGYRFIGTLLETHPVADSRPARTLIIAAGTGEASPMPSEDSEGHDALDASLENRKRRLPPDAENGVPAQPPLPARPTLLFHKKAFLGLAAFVLALGAGLTGLRLLQHRGLLPFHDVTGFSWKDSRIARASLLWMARFGT